MDKEIVYTDLAPEPIGPYSQAVKISSQNNSLLYTSGQIAINPSTSIFEGGDIKEQTRLVLENIKAILNDSGSGLEKVIKTTVFLRTMDDFTEMNKVYAEFFGSSKPARSTIAVSGLPKDALVEIETIAFL